MTPLEKLRFEAYARNCGYNLNKEGDRYCHGVVNQMKDTWAPTSRRAVRRAKR